MDGDLLTLWIRDSTRRDLATRHQRRGWLDYDREKLPGLTLPERIGYFEWRVRRVAINPLERILAMEIEPTAESSAPLLFGVSLCCAIEAAGRFLTGGDDFPLQAFLARYMHQDFGQKKRGADTYGDILRKHFRKGLAHGFAVSLVASKVHPDRTTSVSAPSPASTPSKSIRRRSLTISLSGSRAMRRTSARQRPATRCLSRSTACSRACSSTGIGDSGVRVPEDVV